MQARTRKEFTVERERGPRQAMKHGDMDTKQTMRQRKVKKIIINKIKKLGHGMAQTWLLKNMLFIYFFLTFIL